ncbi:MAG TPA: tetratricopeptide repeat protein, partial [Candidatus Obscuribacterales bacterium]
KGDFENAEKCFRRAVKQSPGSQVAYQGLATIQYLTGNFLAARQSALQSQAIRPYAPVVLLLAKIDFMEGEIQQGQKRLAEYTKLTKAKVTRSMTELGYLPQHDFKWDPFQLDDFDDAAFVEARTAERSKQAARQKTLKASADASISRIEKSLSVAPNDYYLLHELGLIKLSIGDFESAAAKLQQAAKSCPDAYLISLHACVALAQSGKIGAAQAALAEYKQAFPNQRLAPIFESIASQPSQAPVQTSNESNPLFAAPTSKDKAGAKDKPDTGF